MLVLMHIAYTFHPLSLSKGPRAKSTPDLKELPECRRCGVEASQASNSVGTDQAGPQGGVHSWREELYLLISFWVLRGVSLGGSYVDRYGTNIETPSRYALD